MALMDVFNNLHFLRPQLLWLLPFALLILWLLGRRFRHRDGWNAVVDAHLLPAIRVQQGGKASGLLRWATPVFLLGIVALAGPSWHKKPLPVVKNQHALVIALDLSRSMLATDVKPNRLKRAKFKVEDLLKQRKDGQTALVSWAGEAFVVTPLTDDTQTIAAMLDALDPSIMPVQGSRADKALIKSAELIRQAGSRRGDILLITDGVNNPAAQEQAKALAKQGIRVHVLGVGTPEGAPIPVNGGFFTDRHGNIVIPKLDEKALRAVTEVGHGRYHRLSTDDSDLRTILGDATDTSGQSSSANKRPSSSKNEQWVDDGIWLLLALVPLMAILYRRGWLMVVLLAVGTHSTPPTGMAQETTAAPPGQNSPDRHPPGFWHRLWQDLWYNKNQQAAQALRSGQAQQAVQLAHDPRWKAAAAYKSGQYQQAQKTWENLKTPNADDWYNRGNALARAGQLPQALKAYEKALALQPDHADAAYNKKVVEDALKKQQHNKQKQSGQQGQQDHKQSGQQGQQDQNQPGQKNQQDQDQSGEQGQQDQKQSGQQGQQDQKQSGQESQNDMSTQKAESQAEQQRQAQAMEKAQREAEEKARQALSHKQPGEKKTADANQRALQPVESAEEAEQHQAMEQWLRRIPDDPGGLLRRKFQYQYRQRQLNREVDKNPQEQDW